MTFDGRFWFWVLLAVVTILLITLLSPILMPFVAGALIAYLADPLADKLESWGLSRTLSVAIIFIIGTFILLVFILILVPVLSMQIKNFSGVVHWGVDTLKPFLNNIGVDAKLLEIDQLKQLVSDNLKATGGFVSNAFKAISKSGFLLLGWLANLVMIPIISFYLLRDWDRLIAYINDLLPRNVEPVISTLAKDSDEMLGAFLRGQLLVMLGLSIMYTVGLWLVGLEFALLIGLIAGIVSFVPYLGLVVGVSIASIAMMFQADQGFDIFQLFWVFLVFGVAQMVEGMLLTPLLVGERIGLHPVAVIFAVLAGGQLFGFFGVLLALPVAAVLAVIMRHLHDSYKQSQIYQINVD